MKNNYHKSELDRFKPFKLNDLKYGITIQLSGNSPENNVNTKHMILTKDCMKELNLFFKEYQKAINDNPDI